jgi:hypothetical protein
MNRIPALFCELCLALICVGCFSGHSRMMDENSKGLILSPPDSLKAKLNLDLYDGDGQLHEISGVLFAVPHTRYRLELTGPLGVGVGSLLWSGDEWTFLFPTEKKYLKGKGSWVGDGGSGLFPVVNIHQIVAYFWGDLLPDGAQISELKDSADWTLLRGKDASGILFTGAKEEKTGRIAWVERDGVERVTFQDYRNYEMRLLPSEIAFFRGNQCYLRIHVKNVKTDASWGDGVWRLKIPESYTPFRE